MHKLSILIVNYNSSDFINLSLYALRKLTKNPYEVFIIDNGSKVNDYTKLKKYISNYGNTYLERVDTKLTGSMAHGTALNKLVKNVTTPFFSILDADATWLKKGWDEILINKMTGKIKIIGTQAPPKKPQDFPLMFAILFETETFKKLAIDFRPNDLTKNQDTGWEMREKYLLADYQAINLEFKNTRTYKDGPFKKISAAGEYYLDNDYNYIFASHFGRGSNPLAKQTLSFNNKFFRLIFLPINYLLWHIAKYRWVVICKNIINNQN
ncbi:MAG: glycosyltransferase [Parcubacteria group bacterium]